MKNPENDVSISVAVLAGLSVAGAWFYLNYLRFHPAATDAMLRAMETNLHFWTGVVVTAAVNLALAGSFLRRTIGLQKQGSRLKQLEGMGFRFHLATADLISVGAIVLVFALIRVPISVRVRCISLIASDSIVLGIERVICGNFALLAGVLTFIAVRQIRSIKFRSSVHLAAPPLERLSLVLGTTPVLE